MNVHTNLAINGDAGADPALQSVDARMIALIARIRSFEKKLLDLFAEGKLSGTTHTCIGQEVCAASLYAHVDPERDAVFTNHRCHGHFLAYGGPMKALMAEIMGKEGGVCLGRGGSQHLFYKRFFSQGIQGGSLPIAAGYAWLLRRREPGAIVIAHIGDGTLGEGVLYETLNLISLLNLPLLIVLENNGVAQSTDTATTTAGDIAARFSAFGIEVDRRSAYEPIPLWEHLGKVVAGVRKGRPFVQVLDTYRLMAHSKGDDVRPKVDLDRAWSRDHLSQRIAAADPVAIAASERAEVEVELALAELEDAPTQSLVDDAVHAAPSRALFESSADLIVTQDHPAAKVRIAELLNRSLRVALQKDADFVFLGEDIADPYGGAFKVSKGLSSDFSERVISTPISEAALVGFAKGVALAGGRSVAEIMFGDFVTLGTDQIVNQAAKAHHMYGSAVSVATTIRVPSGGYRGYGPTHSQSLERMFCGTPGLKVIALSRRHEAERLLSAATLGDPNPVLFVENKSLYPLMPATEAPLGFRFVPRPSDAPDDYPALHYTSAMPGSIAQATVVTYGGLTDIVEEAMGQLLVEDELDFDYVILTQLYPFRPAALRDSVARTGRLVTIEEGPAAYGIGAEVIASLSTVAAKVARVGAAEIPIPNSRAQERTMLPSVAAVVAAVRRVMQAKS
jgi:2-oxoisovalerate dehydrogenase E1 component